jgi:hypothetical protein
MKTILLVLLLSAPAVATPKSAVGAHDGITVTVTRAEFSKNGTIIVVTAEDADDPAIGFVLICPTDQQYCSFPRVGRQYRVVSERDKKAELWGLVAAERKEKLSIFTLVHASRREQ